MTLREQARSSIDEFLTMVHTCQDDNVFQQYNKIQGLSKGNTATNI
jgi:hypothetical protein